MVQFLVTTDLIIIHSAMGNRRLHIVLSKRETRDPERVKLFSSLQLSRILDLTEEDLIH